MMNKDRYTYTVGNLPFDAIPAACFDNPDVKEVTIDGWEVSLSFGRRPVTDLYIERGSERHELDGTTYPTRRDAQRAAYETGLAGLVVSSSAAARWGLPAV